MLLIIYGTEWPMLCWCAVKKLVTHSRWVSDSSGAAFCVKSLVWTICCRTSATRQWQADCAMPRHSNRCQLGQINFEILSFLIVLNILIRPIITVWLFSSPRWQRFACLCAYYVSLYHFFNIVYFRDCYCTNLATGWLLCEIKHPYT